RIYGLGARSSTGLLRFFEIDGYRFAEDLATSRALISTAGNQLVGEALFLGKPVLAMPEHGNYEQQINAHFLQQSGAGLAVNMAQITANHIHHLLEKFQDIRHVINRDRLYGNPAALKLIAKHLPTPVLSSSYTLA
ncbi:teichoic acid biosynthesis protein, partial [candidate division KSB3 bacterium]|nr:teichoic acid biosynthesis protein [candidate division KSB3 bacterium]MBD3327448.1 teichoic acid biosynthesis protein [candidate division KSB3 bacterium]